MTYTVRHSSIESWPDRDNTSSGRNRILLVDGLPSPWQPLRPEAITSDLDFVVPDDCYGILPGVEVRGYGFSPGNWVAISCVPRHSIYGRAVLRHRPYWRWSML